MSISTAQKDEYQKLLKFPEFLDSEAYIKQIVIALDFDISDEEIAEIQKRYHIYIQDIRKDVKHFESFVNGQREKIS